MYNKEHLITSNEGWPKHLSQYEVQSYHLVRELLQEFEPERFRYLIASFFDALHSKSMFDKIFGRVLGGRKPDQETINDIVNLLTTNEAFFDTVRTSLLGRREVDTTIVNYGVEDTRYKSVYAVGNQHLAQLFYQTLLNESYHEPISKLSVLLHVLAKHQNYLPQAREHNSMLSFLNGGKAQAGIAYMLRGFGGEPIFPNYHNIDEVAEWDVANGVDFVCYIDGELLLIDSKGKRMQRKKNSSGEDVITEYDKISITKRNASDITPQKISIAKQALRTLKQSKKFRVALSEQDIQQHTHCFLIRVPTSPRYMNHIGKLHPDFYQAANADLRRQIGIL